MILHLTRNADYRSFRGLMKSAYSALTRVPEYVIFFLKKRTELVASSSGSTSRSTSQLNGAYNSFFCIH